MLEDIVKCAKKKHSLIINNSLTIVYLGTLVIQSSMNTGVFLEDNYIIEV